MEDLVSVIIPTYKSSDVLGRAIESVIDQTYGNIEILVIDDNIPESKERHDTECLMKSFENKKNVIYIKHPCNKNGAAARNTGIKASKGKYIAFLDDDDWFLPTKISEQVDFLKKNRQYDAAYCFAQKKGNVVDAEPYEGDVSKELLLMKSRMFTPTLIFTAESIKGIGGFDEQFRRHQDYEMLLRYFEAGYKIGCVKKVLVALDNGTWFNDPSVDKMLLIKEEFLSKFSRNIDLIDKHEKGFRNKVIATHYGQVLILCLKERKIRQALKMVCKYSVYSPMCFFMPLYNFSLSYIDRHYLGRK